MADSVTDDQRIAPAEVTTYLRLLADTPEGIPHRTWLFHAAHLIDRGRATTWVCRYCRQPITRPDATVTVTDVTTPFGEDLED